MKGYQYSYNDEINKAKKIFYEGSDTTKKTLITVVLCLLSLLVLLILSFWGTSDTWVCEIDSQSPKHDFICKELRKAVNCKTVSGPIKAEVLLNVNNEVKASALAICPWEIAVSELRVCFVLLSVICVLIGIYSINKESKKIAEIVLQISIKVQSLEELYSLYRVILIIFLFKILTSIIIIYAIYKMNLQLKKEQKFAIKNFNIALKGELIECSFTFYNLTIIFEIISSLLLLLSSKQVYKWKSSIIINEL